MMEPVAEITERLRKGVQTAPGCSHPIAGDIDAADALMAEAADVIVRLSDAEARIAELENELVLMKAVADGTGSLLLDVQRDCIAAVKRANAAEALLKEAKTALEPLCARAEKWSLNSDSARVSVRLGDLRAARSIADKIGARDE